MDKETEVRGGGRRAADHENNIPTDEKTQTHGRFDCINLVEEPEQRGDLIGSIGADPFSFRESDPCCVPPILSCC